MVALLQGPRRARRHSLPAQIDSETSAEAYRQIYISLDVPPHASPFVIGITSAIRGEGRTTVARHLAETLTGALDVPISLIEVDIERPSLAAHYGLTPAPGLCDVLRGACRFDEVFHAIDGNLSLVTAGTPGPDTMRLLRKLALDEPFREADGVISLDLPPLLNPSYSVLAAGMADVILLVVRAGVTPANIVHEAIARLKDRPPQGVVLNGVRSSLPAWWPRRDV